MDIKLLVGENFKFVVIDNTYNDEELNLIQEEILDLKRFSLHPKFTGTAKNENNSFKKNGKGIFLDDLYGQHREQSAILTLNRKLFHKNFIDDLSTKDIFFKHISFCNRDSTLLNYYENNENYNFHSDKSIFTSVTFFSIGVFEKGEFCFPEHEIIIPSLSNRTVIFPGCTTHEAKAISAKPNNFRVSIANFMNYQT